MRESIISQASYISIACNRVPHSADYGKNGILCYGARNSIAVCDLQTTESEKVLQTLYQHKNKVSVVRWIKSNLQELETELISASSDGTAIIWSKRENNYEATSTLVVNDPLSVCHAIYTSENSKSNLLICTGSINGDLQLWKRDNAGETHSFQTLSFGKKIPIQACLSLLPKSSNPLLIIALDDSSIQLFSQNSAESEFFKVQTLFVHEDWITCMDIIHDSDGNSFLATGSQDSLICLWKFSVKKEEIASNELRAKTKKFSVNEIEYEIVLESILSGHEGWVYGVNWHPSIEIDGKLTQPMKLLSCSLDKSMIVWEFSKDNGVWMESVRVGEVGGNSLGFYGCKFGAGGKKILAHGYHGSFHIWNYSEENANWNPCPAPSGHFGEVVDLCWDPKGRFLVTASTDQTTRVHAPWSQKSEFWHEIARPQIHGHDMSCLTMLSPYKFASGAEEKVVRIFTAPSTFITCLKKISSADDFEGVLAEGASLPALGLMNKAIFAQDHKEKAHVGSSKDLTYNQPPVEEELIQHTLWPEEQKLYGHGYEIFSMAARHDGTLLATACKSTNPEYAAILVWDTKTWTQVQRLISHQLTITQLAFSPNDKYLVSVSRDRRWSLFSFDEGKYSLSAASLKKDSLHGRIIWCCAWTNDSKYFATGSRDGKIGIWSEDVHLSNPLLPATSLEIENTSITALAFAPMMLSSNAYILAVGFDNGEIEIKKVVFQENEWIWESLAKYDSSFAHHLTVKRLQFRPQSKSENKLQLASCGSDHLVKIYDIDIERTICK